MTEKFNIKGEWFLPSSPQNRIHGTLNYNPKTGITLELYGSLNSNSIFSIPKNEEIILGLSSDSKLITVYNSFMTKAGGLTLVQSGETGKPSIVYSARYLLIGIHIETSDELKFDSITSEIFNLDEWIGISGFKNKPPNLKKIQNCEVSVDYKLPKSIVFQIDDITEGSFDYTSNYPGFSRFQKTVNINQKVEFSAKTTENKNIDELLKILYTFQNFLVLALYNSTYPISITLSGDSHKNNYKDGTSSRKNVQLFFASTSYNENQNSKVDLEMLFNYNLIKRRFPSIIKVWFSKYEVLEPSFNLVFEQFYRQSVFNENSFLNLAQSAETFHASVHNHTKIPKEKYKAMKEEILTIAPAKYHSWLNDQFNFGNNLNLHTRLTEVVKKYSNDILDRILGDKTTFVLNVKNSRNYYTHYSSSGNKKALKGAELYYLSEKLKILLVCSFLMEVGFKKDELSKSMENVKWKLFSHLTDWK